MDIHALINIRDTDPSINDDETDNYGSVRLWLNTVNKALFISSDQSEGAAVWDKISSMPITQSGTMDLDDGDNSETGINYHAIINDKIIQIYANLPNTLLNIGMLNISNVSPSLPEPIPSQVMMSAKGNLIFHYICN